MLRYAPSGAVQTTDHHLMMMVRTEKKKKPRYRLLHQIINRLGRLSGKEEGVEKGANKMDTICLRPSDNGVAVAAI